MVIGVLRLSLFTGEAQSLKDKRRVLSGLKDRIRNRFNVSVAETGGQDLHQHAEIAVAAVSSDAQYLNGQLDAVLDFISRNPRIVVNSHEIEVF